MPTLQQTTGWKNQRTWHIDPVNGNDSYPGSTSRKALKTFREYLNRTASEGFREYTQRVDIHILNDLPRMTYAPT
ncbi:hypothetical protein SAMN05660964_01232 [Thiothrix caldifontis]|uniref:Uncharacterized protein n=1 Tax=Thiothrix caldifontis TaxID=525918 RepID=A0A1H3ZMI1_9GAMM|nr:hypothetical protein [Thiothrix caldifontis]SEA24855.1 hypothetical protein SAMN05660964_01232 [Thiothrix caldifontis]